MSLQNNIQIKNLSLVIPQSKKELDFENIPYKADIPIGIMVETAAAAIMSDCLAKVSDFFSLGTNDLTQYTLGIDRENMHVAGLYNEFSLAI